MNKPIYDKHSNLIKQLENARINTDINNRWENGINHHPESERLADEIDSIDWLYLNDFFGFKFGGDGDNGEFLLYILDILFELRDAEEASKHDTA